MQVRLVQQQVDGHTQNKTNPSCVSADSTVGNLEKGYLKHSKQQELRSTIYFIFYKLYCSVFYEQHFHFFHYRIAKYSNLKNNEVYLFMKPRKSNICFSKTPQQCENTKLLKPCCETFTFKRQSTRNSWQITIAVNHGLQQSNSSATPQGNVLKPAPQWRV